MHNPLRSEADAFRWFVVVLVGAISVGVLAALTRPLVGVIWAALLICVGGAIAYRNSRGRILPADAPLTRGGDGRHRLLVVANETVGGAALLEEIGRRCQGRDCEILVITPALAASRADHWASDIDEAIVLARQRMELSVIEIEQRLGRSARGEIGDSDPNLAIGDALRVFAADEIVISTHPPQSSRWLERGVVDRARDEIDLPISHVVVDLAGERGQPAASR